MRHLGLPFRGFQPYLAIKIPEILSDFLRYPILGIEPVTLARWPRIKYGKWVNAEHDGKEFNSYEPHGLKYRYGTCHTILTTKTPPPIIIYNL